MIDAMLEHEGFDKVDKDGNKDLTDGKLILITTSVMDAGVNIWDDDLKLVVCDNIQDTEKLIQCIGRKRRHEGEKINLHIRLISSKKLGGIESKAQINNSKADYLKENGCEKYIKKHGRSMDKTNTVYLVNKEDGSIDLKVNDMRYTYNFIKYHEMQYIKKNNSNYADYNYCEYIKSKFNFDSIYYIYEVKVENKNIKGYLEAIVGTQLFEDEQNKLKEMFKENGLITRTIGINTLNGNLKDRKLPFVISIGKRKSYRDTNGSVKKRKSHWVVEEI